MNFIDNILEIFGLSSIPKDCSFKAILIDDMAYFENVCGINHYSPEEILISIKRGSVVISGENLYVKKYCSGDLAICGKIKSIARA